MAGKKADKIAKKEKKALKTQQKLATEQETQAAQQLLCDLRDKMNIIGEQLQKMTAKYNASMKEEQSSIITKKDVESNNEGAVLYERMGRVFIKRPYQQTLDNLQTTGDEAAKQSKNLKIFIAQLQIKLKTETAQYHTVMRDIQRGYVQTRQGDSMPKPTV